MVSKSELIARGRVTRLTIQRLNIELEKSMGQNPAEVRRLMRDAQADATMLASVYDRFRRGE